MKEYKYTINGDTYEVKINEVAETTANVTVNGTEYTVEWEKPQEKKPEPAAEKPAAPASLKPTDEEFYHDPLVELALKEFHATIIK